MLPIKFKYKLIYLFDEYLDILVLSRIKDMIS